MGYTLIEIMIALVVFAILAVITSTALYQAFETRTRLNEQSSRLSELQLALALMNKDIEQTIDRPIREAEMTIAPAFIGEHTYLEFTRGGLLNPQALEKRSTLKRIAYRCTNNSLIRQSWERTDSPDRHSEEEIILHNLSECTFAYLDRNRQVLDSWQESLQTRSLKREPLPIAVQLTLTIKEWGNMSLLLIIPGSLYAA